jgi:type II secretory pathway pseudopilin PulG
MIIALAIMSLGAAIIVPRAATALDQVVVHSVFFDFQRQISDLRSAAFADQQGYTLVSSQGAAPNEDRGQEVTIPLRAGWQYRVERPITISSGGLCSEGGVDLMNLGRVAAHLETRDGACHFLRTY